MLSPIFFHLSLEKDSTLHCRPAGWTHLLFIIRSPSSSGIQFACCKNRSISMSKQLHLCLAAAALFLTICNASLTPDQRDKFLQAHNEARAAVGVKPLQWSKNIASYASKLAQHPGVAASCDLSQNAKSSRYGANQAVANLFDSPETLVGSWVNEGKCYYNYEHNSCEAGHQDECDSYTQVVWKKTVKLGCGKGNCGKDGSHTICLYYPPGNVYGEKPY